MEKITIRNPKNESIIISVILLLLGGIILYWGLSSDMKLQISGAKLDKSTSKYLLILISFGPFLTAINYILKFISIIKYGDFSISLEQNKIIYPDYQMFSGYYKKEIEKEKIAYVDVVNLGKGEFNIYFRNKENASFAYLTNDICTKDLKPIDLANKINNWLKK